MSRQVNWINVFWLFGTPVAMLVTGALFFHYETPTWGFFLLFLISAAMTNLSITAGYHRFLAHRSYDANPWVKFIYLFIGAGAFQGSALEWATDHRRHHRMVDTNDDPYNINQGFWHAHMGWLLVKQDQKYAGVFPADLSEDRFIAWQHKYYGLIAIAAGFGVPMLIGYAMGSVLGGLFFGGFLRVVMTQHCTFFINSLCHCVGRQPYTTKNSARDSFIMAILAFGEGYHNYHHRFQSDYRNGIRWYHWDPSKWLIRMLALCGLAHRLKVIPAPIVLRVRMQSEQVRLLAHGIPADKVSAMRMRVEEAQAKLRVAYEDYRSFKKNVRERSHQRLLHLKAEVRVARLELKMSCAQWYAYIRTLKAQPAYT